MDEFALLESLGVFTIAAAVMVALARSVRMPSIVAYLLAGLLVGPVTGWLGRPLAAHAGAGAIGELGIVLLMFLVGAELSFARIRQVGGVALAAGLGQVVFTALGGFAICMGLGFAVMESIFLATALTFSSTVVVVKLLDQKGDLDALYGQIAVGIFLVQDLVVIVVLTFLAGLDAPQSLGLASVGLGTLKAFAGMAAMLAGCIVAARRVLPRPFAWAARSPRTLFVWSLAWCFACVLVAHALALSAEIGAFLAGLSVAQLSCAHELRRRVHPLMNFFVAVFFIALGARLELAEAGLYWFEAVVLALFVLIGNPLIFMAILARYRYSERTCFATSVTVAQISEFSFIFAASGVRAGLIGAPVLAIVGVVGVVTIAASAYMILYSDGLHRRIAATGVLRVFRAAAQDDEPAAPELAGHVIVAGMNALGRELAERLHARGETVLAIDADPRKLTGLPCRVLPGDVEYPSTLAEAGLPRAKLAIASMRDEAASRVFALRCRQRGVPVVLHGFDRAALPGLREVAPDLVIDSKAEGGRAIARILAERGLVAS